MKTGIIATLISVFLLLAFALLSLFHETKPRILVLHSFSREDSSVINLDQGIRKVLLNNRQPLSLRWHYLAIDTQPNESHRREVAEQGKRVIDQFDPDVLIAVDDEAQEYVARYYVGHTRAKIFFTAIDHDPKSYGYIRKDNTPVANVAGVMETLPLVPLRDALSAMYHRPLRLGVLSMSGVTGHGELQQVLHFNWAPDQIVSQVYAEDFPTWQAAIQQMNTHVDAILVLDYAGLHVSPFSTVNVPNEEIVRWIDQHSTALPIGISTDYVRDGGALSISPSAEEMGETAAHQALVWLKAEPSTTPASVISHSGRYRIAVRDQALRARHIALPDIYVANAQLDQLYWP